MARRLNGANEAPAPFDRIEGLEHLDKVIDIDQFADRPHATLEPGDLHRRLHADPRVVRRLARVQKRAATSPAASRSTSRAAAGGEACQGDVGVIKIEMHFLPDVFMSLYDVCKGKRYNRETLEVVFKNKSIADVLDMTVEEAARFLLAVLRVCGELLALLHRVGLDYNHVGQQATTLSGGEAQRVKLAKELSKRATGRSLYILDEPTTGLHFHDVAKAFSKRCTSLVESGNTIVVIEHTLEVIKTADWVIDLGPGRRRRQRRNRRSGDAGGYRAGEAELYRPVLEAGARARRRQQEEAG